MNWARIAQTRNLDDLRQDRDAYLRDGQAPAKVRPMVLESWERSRSYGVHPAQLRRQEVAPEKLGNARQQSAALIAAAQPFLDLVHGTLAEEPHIVALADSNGLILRLLSGPGLENVDLDATNLVEGASWDEGDIGCNGVGTCLATGEPVILIGPEHFQESYVGWTCIGAPIRNEAGVIVGALDLSVPNEHAHVHGWGWALALARGIESSLARERVARVTEIEQVAVEAERPLRSVTATFDLLATKLGTSPTHTDFLEEARAALQAAEQDREARIRELETALRERSRAEQALAREHEFLQRLIDSIPVMVTVYDPAIHEIHLNPYVAKVVGWTNEDVRDADVLELCYPDPEYREKVRRFMQAPGPAWLDIEMRAKDGSMVPTTWANIRLSDDRQVGIGIDLTERKATERQLREAYKAAQKALQEHDNVLAVVSHDLRNPLNTMRMASSLLLEDIPEEKKRSQILILRRAVDQMTRLIEDLLDAARVEGGGMRVHQEPCRSDELVRAALDQMMPLADSASVTLTAAAVPATRVDADPARVAQVFSNLIGNAIHHTPAEGTVIVKAVDTDEREVRFSVCDTGPGIATADLTRVFDRYWQARKTRSAGAGLGLAIAKGIVAAHGGRIWAESETGAGAVFSFTLPVSND